MRRLKAFLHAETGLARADYAGVLLLVMLIEQIAVREGGAMGAVLRPAFGFLG